MAGSREGTEGARGSTTQSSSIDDPLWRLVDDWPQVPNYLRQTLDADLIPKHAVAVLRRELDFGRVIAFVGSGVSMSYGRLGWGELIQWMMKSADRKGNWKVEDLGPINATLGARQKDAAPGGGQTSTVAHMDRLLNSLGINNAQTSLDIQSGRYPAAFQFLEQCAKESEVPSERGERQKESTLRSCLRAMLRDDAGQAYLLFERLFDDLSRKFRGKQKPYEGIWQTDSNGLDPTLKELGRRWKDVHHYISSSMVPDSPVWRGRLDCPEDGVAWQSTFSVRPGAITEFSSALDGPIAKQLCADVRFALFGSAGDDEPARVLAPLQRFAIMALVRLDPAKACSNLWEKKSGQNREMPSRRAERIGEGRDPLLTLMRDFGLTRFATTNYDLDIEQAVLDLGYDSASLTNRFDTRSVMPGRGLSRNALGMTAHDSVFEHSKAAELLRFAGARGTAVQVIHLHGRVFPGEPLVITEDDYQATYLQRSDVADAANDAISLAMRSNTVLFIGSGMNEDDILRPMRQFVTERKSSADRSGVVLLPADGTRAREIEDVIALYSRYGVLTKHFGVAGGPKEVEGPNQVRWLAAWLALTAHLKKVVGQLRETFRKGKPLEGAFDSAWETLCAAPESCQRSIALYPVKINGILMGELLASLGQSRKFNDLAEISLIRAAARALTGLLQEPLGKNIEARSKVWQNTLRAIDVQLTSPAERPSRTETIRLVDAVHELLIGVGGSLRSLAMMLELASLHKSWLEWKVNRMAAPPARPVGGQRRRATGGGPLIFGRNRLALRSLGTRSESASGALSGALSRVPRTDRFVMEAPSHSFSRFTEALHAFGLWPLCESRRALRQRSFSNTSLAHWRAHSPLESNGSPKTWKAGRRRLFLMLARRGLGKGHFFEMLAEDGRVKSFIHSSWGIDGSAQENGGGSSPPYALACYVNLGLSLEFLSAFDRLSLALVEVADVVFASDEGRPTCDAIRHAARSLERNRLARLRAVLKIYAQDAHLAQARVLVAFNGFGQFYDRLGAPKNAQLHRLIDSLLGDAAADVPLDVLMLCQDEDVPGCFRRGGLRLPITENDDLDGWSGIQNQSLIHLVEPTAQERLKRKLSQVIDGLKLNVAAPSCGSHAWLHVLRGAQASATVGKYFPDVAVAVAFGTTDDKWLPACTMPDFREWQDRRINALSDSEQEIGQRVISDLDSLCSSFKKNAKKRSSHEAEIDRRFAELHRATRRNRYLLTIVCAAASERGWRRADEAGPKWEFNPAAVWQWLEAVKLDVSNHLPDDAVDRIIAKVLASHQQQHEQGQECPAFHFADAYPKGPDGQIGLPMAEKLCELLKPLIGDTKINLQSAVSQVLCGPLAWRLQQRLLWHLAVMALVVQADVLATAPLVEADCRLMVAEMVRARVSDVTVDQLRQDGICRALVEMMLDQLVHRCLVFRMEPVHLGSKEALLGQVEAVEPPGEDEGSEEIDTGWRFTIHRYLQRTILEQLKSPFVEFPKVDQFGLSLWVTQPDELPRPNRSAAHDIADLVAAWIGFPKNTEVIRTTTTFHWFKCKAQVAAKSLKEDAEKEPEKTVARWRDVTLPARMLRAALGVLRATYSVAVVSRFHDFDDDGAGLSAPEEGYFKQHHLQVRWLLEQANVLASETGDLKALKDAFDPKADRATISERRVWQWGLAQEAVAPFFADELVWLNNECGLFCLVEGRLENAAGMFRQALIAAEEVEGRDPHGALWCRIHLNLAIVDIERGRIREADERLAIIEGIPDENPILRILARGFRALVEHLSGNLSRAEEIYVKVIKDLVQLRQLRSVAIFSRHLAELHRLQGESAAVKAFHAIEQSIAAATKGGHEDIRHLAVLSRVRLAIAGVLPAEVMSREANAIQVDLDAVEHYGRVMGMPRLMADVAFARAQALLNLGETRHAARLAHQSLAVCSANGLRLRQMTGMALLGRIYRARGLTHLAEPLLAQAYAMAVDCHYGNMREVSASSPSAGGPSAGR